MNTQVAGQYIFAGGNSGVPPVNIANYPSYYQGDDNPPSVRVSQQQTIQYGVLASNPAFSQALSAMKTAINAFSDVGTVPSPAVTTAETSATTPLGLNGTFAIDGGATVNVVSSDSLTDIMNKINANAGTTGVNATLSGTSLTIAGASANLTFTNQSGTALSSLGITPTQTTPTLAQSNQMLDQALQVAQQAQTTLSNLQQTVATSSSQLLTLGQQQSTFVTYLQNSLSDVKDVNTGEVASQVSQYQTQLQASYMAVASVTKLSLAQFL
jgi:flagellin-like hook-associated protein FlgL